MLRSVALVHATLARPPGTGKTLCARALSNECSKAGKHVSFFMRKGADCLSKWVGEAERMLRLLFDQAHKMRPSIIFFDEIDGLAPVRSSRTSQESVNVRGSGLVAVAHIWMQADTMVELPQCGFNLRLRESRC
jgi:SpoVK/Ycf46/Vps4 family AAA+-type ATPase